MIVNSQLQSTIVLHDTLHGFRLGRGTGLAVMEAKVEQKLAGMVHDPLFEVFIDVQKAYDSLDIGICMDIIQGYILGPNLQRLLQRYWDRQKVVPKARNLYGHYFSTGLGVTQGYPVSLTIFNIVVDVVVRAALLEVCRPQEDQHGFIWAAGEHNICFYADDGQIVDHNPIWVHTSLTEMVKMFDRVGLQKNLSKTKAMVCTPGFI